MARRPEDRKKPVEVAKPRRQAEPVAPLKAALGFSWGGTKTPFGRRGGAPAFALTVVGQDDPELGIATDSIGTYGAIGEHTSISYIATLNGGNVPLEAVKWSNSSNPASAATYGTGLNPTDIALADNGTVYLHGQYGGVWYTRSFPVRYRPGQLPAFAPQSFTVGVGGTYQHPAAIGPGLTWTYAQVAAVAGVTYDAGTRTFTYATSLAEQTGTAYGASATDQYGRPASASPRTSTFAIAVGDITAPTASAVVAGTQSATGDVPVSINGLSEDSTLFWVAVPTGSATPSAPQVVAGQNGSGGTPSGSGSQAVTLGGGPYSLALPSGLGSVNYDLHIVFRDAANNNSTVFSNTNIAIDTTAPTVSLSPADGATGVTATANIVMTFSEAMKTQGTVDLRVVGGASIQSFNLASQGTWSAGNTVWTGNPTADFNAGAALCVRWSGLEDTKGNTLADNTGDTQWNFTVAGAPTGISVVGDVLSATSWDGTTNVSRTLTFTTAPQQNDIIVVVRGRQDTDAVTLISGYTNESNLSQPRLRVDWLRCGVSPPTSVVIPAEADTPPVTMIAVVLRGVNTTTTFDVTTTTASATGAAASITAPSITPTTNGCFILSAAVYNDRTRIMDAYPANLNLINAVVGANNASTTTANTLAIGGHLQATAGAFSPGVFDFEGTTVEDLRAVTMAFRPA
jgi:hypothetical protein